MKFLLVYGLALAIQGFGLASYSDASVESRLEVGNLNPAEPTFREASPVGKSDQSGDLNPEGFREKYRDMTPGEPDIEIAGYMVRYKQGVRPVDLQGNPIVPDLLNDINFSLDGRIDGYLVLDAFGNVPGEVAALGVEVLKQQTYVEDVIPNNIVRAVEDELASLGTAGVQSNSKNWGLDRIDQRNAKLDRKYSYRESGEGVRIYIVDSGIDNHSDFDGRLITGWSSVRNSTNTDDCNGHGTHVAGIASGTDFGIAKGSTIVPVQVLGCNGSGTDAQSAEGLQWILDNHPAGTPGVINLSLGTRYFAGAGSSLTERKLQSLIDSGLVVVVAAGNDYLPVCGATFEYSPARLPDAITVGASTKRDSEAIWGSRYDSWYGSWLGGTNWGECLDLFAPGDAITSARHNSNGAVSFNGTSMAAPFVAGVAARILEANPEFTPAEVWTAISDNSTEEEIGSPDYGDPSKLLFADPAGLFEAPPIPVVSGTAAVGEVLTADPGEWRFAGTSFDYEWVRGSGRRAVVLEGETSDTYTVVEADFGQPLSVRVTGSKLGFMSVTKQSRPTAKVAGSFGEVPTPSVSETNPVVGDVLSVDPGDWGAGVKFSYQWNLDGEPIRGQKRSSLKVLDGHVGGVISVDVSGIKRGYATTLVTSDDTSTVSGLIRASNRGGFSLTRSVVEYGEELEVAPFSLNVSDGAAIQYQWYRDGEAIAGATLSSYTTAIEDVGANVSVAIYITREGYEDLLVELAVDSVRGASFPTSPIPVVSGTAAVGEVLTADSGDWEAAGTSFDYEWVRGSGRRAVVLEGETSDTYTVVEADFGQPLSVRVTGSKLGFMSVTKQSRPTAKVAGSFGEVPTPSVSETNPVVGDVLSVDPGDWGAGVKFSYQWNLDGEPIRGQKRSSLKVLDGHVGGVISVDVSGRKRGYATTLVTSDDTSTVLNR